MPPIERIPSRIEALLANKNASERATIKGIEIAKAVKKKKYKRDKATGLWK